MTDPFAAMMAAGAGRLLLLNDPASGLNAIIALDELRIGPACGGIRTQPYPGFAEALADAQRLAAAMTLKAAIAGIPAGGGKTVVIDRPGLDRPAAFLRLGAFIEELKGLYFCAGDLGTTYDDLLNVAKATRYCDTTGQQLGQMTGIGIVHCIRAVAADRGIGRLSDLSIAIQGCGLIGAGVARMMAAEGARVLVADLDNARAAALADEIGGEIIAVDAVIGADVDIVSPCAVGNVLTVESVEQVRAWAICGGANNQLAIPELADRLAARDIGYVPDFLASAGALIDGASRTITYDDPLPRLAALGETTATVLARARAEARSTVAVATELARERIAAAVG